MNASNWWIGVFAVSLLLQTETVGDGRRKSRGSKRSSGSTHLEVDPICWCGGGPWPCCEAMLWIWKTSCERQSRVRREPFYEAFPLRILTLAFSSENKSLLRGIDSLNFVLCVSPLTESH